MTLIHKVAEGIVKVWHDSAYPDPADEDLDSLTAKERHDRGLCNKALLLYECHGRDDYAECG
jgi:hypothetical protein